MIAFAVAFISLVGLMLLAVVLLGWWPMPPEEAEESDRTFDRPFDWQKD